MKQDKYPKDSAVQLIWGAELKLRHIRQEIEQFAESRRMASVQLIRISNALFLLEEARHMLSAAEDAPELTQEDLPF